MTTALRNEEEYQKVKKLLTGMKASSGPPDAPRQDKPEFFYLQDQQQFAELCAFLRSLKKKPN